MSKHRNADVEAVGKWANFSGLVGQTLWPAMKPAVSRSEFDFSKYTTVATVRNALRRGFLADELLSAAKLDLNLGHVPKDELAGLSIWNLKQLYQLFYLQAFGLFLDFPDELMPEAEAPDEFSWPVCVPGIISNEGVFQSGNINIPRWKYTNDSLDVVMDLSRGRDAWLHSFIIRVRPNWEADEDMKNLSANDIEKAGINIRMFRERFILGLFIFWLTGEHLDRKTATLSGSRFLAGGVPVVYWFGDKFHVHWCDSDVASGHLRSRQAVS